MVTCCGLADAVGPVRGLVLHRRVPPGVEVEDVGGAGQVEPLAAGLEADEEDRAARSLFWKRLHQILPLRNRRGAVQAQEGRVPVPFSPSSTMSR